MFHLRRGLQSRESREPPGARRRREGGRGEGGPARPHPARGQLRVLCAQEKRRLQEEISAARRELEEEKLRVERLKVGGGQGRLLSPGNEVGVSVRVSSGNQRRLCLNMGGGIGSSFGGGRPPQLGRVGGCDGDICSTFGKSMGTMEVFVPLWGREGLIGTLSSPLGVFVPFWKGWGDRWVFFFQRGKAMGW